MVVNYRWSLNVSGHLSWFDCSLMCTNDVHKFVLRSTHKAACHFSILCTPGYITNTIMSERLPEMCMNYVCKKKMYVHDMYTALFYIIIKIQVIRVCITYLNAIF